jgi:hypothetical protein
MTWTVTKNAEGGYDCHYGSRLRARIQKDSPRSWRVTRVDSLGNEGGCDTFHSFTEAYEFVTQRPGIWGC